MNDQQIREIAEAAFRAHFDIEVFPANIWRGFDFEDDPMPVVDVHIIYDGKYEALRGRRFLNVDGEIIDKVWSDADDSPSPRTSTTSPSPKSGGWKSPEKPGRRPGGGDALARWRPCRRRPRQRPCAGLVRP